MSDGIMNQRIVGIVPAPKLESTSENDSLIKKHQTIFSMKISMS